MIALLIYIVILLLVFAVIFYVIDQMPFIAQPWKNIIRVIVALILLLILIQILLGNLGGVRIIR